ncbi:probable WRKY transcription factor 14 [Aristolochia californica]|uniref:probable WRKY transcription factor 14 n=1 Tax=Aristolochia californica TaxID=171875 RepID=UPI0035DA2DE0
MCSFFWQRMENDQGDLADIVRASGGGANSVASNNPISDWQFPSEATNLPSGMEDPVEDFGDPFSSMRNPLLHELDLAGSVFFNSSNPAGLVKMNMEEEESVAEGNFLAQTILGGDMKRPSNIFSRMLQISPNPKIAISPSSNSPSPVAASPRGGSVATSSLGCSVDNGGVQISSPRNPGIKRRKSQAKKVVCIPAPAAANSRPSGEIVPSDLWAWRKYGQKPIKGSPYPRGYYRCSSSKGCSARKQVERSRTDPNMLVITYTSEHNHPWPTQRNALAGSTRSQPAKSNAASKNPTSTSTPKPTNMKEEHKENQNNNTSAVTAGGSMNPSTVKEEMGETDKPTTKMEEHIFDPTHQQGLHPSYRPIPLPDSHQPDDLFAGLGELDPDPLNLIFSQGFGGEKSDEDAENKEALDPFSLFDWPGNSFGGETRKGL